MDSEEVPEQSPVESTAEDSDTSKEEDPKSSSEEWTELDKDGWENILGSGRLRRKYNYSCPGSRSTSDKR